MVAYVAKDFSHLFGTPGFSDALLSQHFDLYQAYVKNASELSQLLDDARRSGRAGEASAGGLRRRFAWEWNGMRLHELYFGNLTAKKTSPKGAPSLGDELTKSFGSFEAWSKDFRAVGGLRGVGWAALVRDPVLDRMHNLWIDEHNVGHLAGGHPLLLMDVFEHAFLTDYGTKRADYIEAFFGAIDWKAVEGRFVQSTSSVLQEAAARP